jgi:hypothetical protein
MTEVKGCARPRSLWTATFLAMGVIVLGPGCSGIGGLRSIAPEWPSLRGIWDRSGPGSPLPENDTYAQGMHGIASGPRASDKPAAKGAAPAREKDSVSPGQPAAPTEVAPAAPRAAQSRRSDPDDGIRVTLGPPEPLPGLVAGTRPGRLAAAAGAPQWKADQSDRDRENIEIAAAPADRPGPDDSGRAEFEDPAHPPNDPDSGVLLAAAQTKLDKLKAYQVAITRQERVEGQLQPQEDILLSIRRDPRAVRLEWTDGPSKGREVIYSSTLDPRMIFVHQPSTAVVLPSMKIPVDSPLVMKNSRHKITEAGFDTILESLRKAQESAGGERSAGPRLIYKGLETPDGNDRPCHHFLQRSTNGQTWNVYLDSRSMLPRLVVTEDSRGELLERYVYRDVRENPAELASAGAFEPDQRWGDSQGLISRLARAAVGANLPNSSAATKR